ncbi:MAG: hypothetical protein M3O61_12070 [Gemmatimonadota bacterium]|nr:hypothetical protein [Gemmatimonadota bacterium]
MKTKKQISVEEFDAWVVEQNKIFAIRERLERNPKMKAQLYSLAGKGLRSHKAAHTLKQRTARIEVAVVAALKALGDDYPAEYFNGQRFRLKKGAEYLARAIPQSLQQVLDAENAIPENEENLVRSLQRWGKTLKSWTRPERDREHDASQERYAIDLSRARERRERNHSQLMQEAAAELYRAET